MSLYLKKTHKGLVLFTHSGIVTNTIILTFEQHFITYPTQHTLRVDEHKHQLSTNKNLHENFVNHSCIPNAKIDWENLTLVSIRDILPDEEITYDYMTSDWDHEDPFECKCGAKYCRGNLQGAKYLDLAEQLYMFDDFSPYIRGMIVKNGS